MRGLGLMGSRDVERLLGFRGCAFALCFTWSTRVLSFDFERMGAVELKLCPMECVC